MTGAYYALRRFTQTAYKIKGLGLGRTCEFVRRWAAKHGPQAPLLISDFRGDARFRCFLREHMGSQIFFRGSYSGDQLTVIERLLNADSVFLDVGANQGEFSIAAARVVRRGKVIAFEPVSEHRERLLENVRLNNFKNVHVISAALGEEAGSLPIYDRQGNFRDGTRHEGLPTLYASSSRDHVCEVVEVKRLDDLLRELRVSHVDVIKLDIEGAEWSALRGAMATLTRCRPVLILEIAQETCQAAGYEPVALIEWLANLGYRMEKIIEGGKSLPINPALLGEFQNIIAHPE